MNEPSVARPPVEERRHVRRQRVLKGALVVFGAFERVVDCAIRDLSEDGARLTLPSTAGIPETFHLLIPVEHKIAPARSIWRTSREIGIALTGPWQKHEGRG
jgi:hypothetical protein